MTHFEKLKNLALDGLADWLDKNGMFDDSPWLNWFSKKYCESCESIKCTYIDAEEKLDITPYFEDTSIECAYCELIDESGIRKCRFFPELNDVPDNKEMIKMWLEEKEDND